MVLGDELSDEIAEFLEAYSLPTGVIDADGRWLHQNSSLRGYLAPLEKKCFFDLLKEPKQEHAIRKLILRNQQIQLADTKLISPIADMIVRSARVRLISSRRTVYLIEFHLRSQHLQPFSSLNRLYQVQNQHGKKTLTADKRLQRVISESRLDPLTQIANRRALDERMLAVWKKAFLNRTPFSFLMLDLDFFKKINDVYGHSQGDQVLIKIAETLVANVNRPDDFVARFGGEEFSVLLPNTDTAGTKWIAEKLLAAVRRLNIPHTGSETAKYVTLSIGSYTIKPPQPEADLSTVIHLADRALYRAKAQGRNCAVHHHETSSDSSNAH